ncbi:MAG: serine/threonine protein kinase, partial [Myxococcales bacterium]|nr:serine/threonine protein kinase [Myxococcales bacterium]
MGVVYRAHDPQLDREVAVKLLRPDGPQGEDVSRARSRLYREARAMARLAHPNVIHVYDFGAHEGQVFVAMELVDGVNLARWLERQPRSPRDPRAILSVFLAAGEGLVAAHDAGLVHRDFKPENVLVGDDGRVRVLDFGLARAPGGEVGEGGRARSSDAPARDASPAVDDGETLASGSLTPEASLTRTGALVGTPRYMAREQILGRPADARTDQFSFCVAL